MFNLNKAMNLKERGVTVGDLLIILIIIISTIFVVNKFNKNEKQSHLYQNVKVFPTTKF